ncbi:hypothetical protein CDAR_462961 [Caerostris darwini]|uniref:Uncharacterized protein n=1 Tax=Caerostris darwini TaxID=1538125 RepID=A0AAV4Q6T8_9ARAC|nr:hypothetical protein CDAR_462961 [Caerostris darwini]
MRANSRVLAPWTIASAAMDANVSRCNYPSHAKLRIHFGQIRISGYRQQRGLKKASEPPAFCKLLSPHSVKREKILFSGFVAEKDYLLLFASANTDESAKRAVDLHCYSLTLQPATECIAELSEASAA